MASTNLPKTVLLSPGQCVSSEDPQLSPYSTVRNRAKFNEIVYVNALQGQEEAHQNRLKNLRKELDYIKSTAWKYDPIEKYIGQY